VVTSADEDAALYYRFAGSTPALERIELEALIERMRAGQGPAIQRRRYRGRDYDACFVGGEAVEWISRSLGLTREETVTLSQRLLDLGVVHHVLDDHPFTDGFFYRFRTHEYGTGVARGGSASR
jgi:hypothetical protein